MEGASDAYSQPEAAPLSEDVPVDAQARVTRVGLRWAGDKCAQLQKYFIS